LIKAILLESGLGPERKYNYSFVMPDSEAPGYKIKIHKKENGI